MMKLPLSLISATSLTSALLQLLASRTVAHLSVPSCTGATLPCLLHCCNLLVSRVLGILHCRSLCCSIIIRLYRHLLVLLLLIGALVARYNPRGWVPRGPCPSSPVVRLTTTQCLPTSSLEVYEHSWYNHHLSPLLSPLVLAQPWSQKPLPCSSSSHWLT